MESYKPRIKHNNCIWIRAIKNEMCTYSNLNAGYMSSSKGFCSDGFLTFGYLTKNYNHADQIEIYGTFEGYHIQGDLNEINIYYQEDYTKY